MSTGQTTPSAGRNSRSESGRSSRRSRRGEDTTPAKLSVPKHFFFSRDESRNCFNFQLKPTVNAHKRVICDGCLYTLNNAGGILTPDLISRTRGTNVKKKCQRPWDQTWKDHPDRGKVQRHNDFMALFEDETTIITPVSHPVDMRSLRGSPAKKKKKSKATNNKQSKETEEQEETEVDLLLPKRLNPGSIVIFDHNGHLTDETVSGYKKIEEKAAATTEGKDQVAFREKIELQLKKAQRYKDFLTEQLKDAQSAVAFQHEISANITSRTDELEELEERLEDDFHLTEEEARELNDRKHRLAAELEQLRGQVQSDVEANQDVIGENVDYVQMLLEQLTITNETIVELEQYVKNHNSHSARVVNTVMKSNGVDQETYFSGALVGNHCMTYAERGDKIYDGIFKELEPIIQNNNLRSELSAFTERMKAIVKLWFKIQRVIKSVEKHSDESIAQFEKDADELKELVYKLCKDDCPISGWKPKLTRSMKAHLLFGGHLVRQLRLWGTLGGIDEQNIESAHAIWNKLLRQFGATRGTEIQKKVLREYLFQTEDFLHLIIARVKEEGKRNLKSRGNDTNELPRARPAQRRIVNDELDIEGLQNDSLEIGPLAVNINNEVALHQELIVEEPMDGEIEASNKVTSDDTMICRCKIVGCEKLRLKLAFDVHKYESHQMIKS